MKTLKYLSVGILLLVAISCRSLNSINPLLQLSKNTWETELIMGQPLDLKEVPGGLPSLSFLEGGKLAGFTGCNNFSGNFSLEGTSIQLDPGAMTKKSCPGSSEQDFIAAIIRASQLRITKDRLTLLNDSTELMSLTPKED